MPALTSSCGLALELVEFHALKEPPDFSTNRQPGVRVFFSLSSSFFDTGCGFGPQCLIGVSWASSCALSQAVVTWRQLVMHPCGVQ
jgi:hypothetical protein